MPGAASASRRRDRVRVDAVPIAADPAARGRFAVVRGGHVHGEADGLALDEGQLPAGRDGEHVDARADSCCWRRARRE